MIVNWPEFDTWMLIHGWFFILAPMLIIILFQPAKPKK
jgi:hypothetical protein